MINSFFGDDNGGVLSLARVSQIGGWGYAGVVAAGCLLGLDGQGQS